MEQVLGWPDGIDRNGFQIPPGCLAFINAHKFNREGDATLDGLSWNDAVEEAGKWIGTLHLGRDLTGKTVDLTDAVKTLKFEGTFRRMVLQAVQRKLKKRGARKVIIPMADLPQ